MTLTPEDVRKKTFTPVRLREGYDMGEVDQFLDEVEVELTRLQQDNEELQSKVTTPSATASTASTVEETSAQQDSAQTALPLVRTIPEASSAAARLLEIATQNAEQLVFEAHGDADKIVGEATVKAERLESESKEKAEVLEKEALSRAESLDRETAQRREQLLGSLERDKGSLATELEDLRAFEREYRSRLRGYFESQLRVLDGDPDGTDAALPSSSEDGTSSALRELLAEEPQQ